VTENSVEHFSRKFSRTSGTISDPTYIRTNTKDIKLI